MPLIKALQTCDKLFSLVVNPGFYCLVISRANVWHFIHLSLLIFPQQHGYFPKEPLNSHSVSFDWMPSPKVWESRLESVCEETWASLLDHHLAAWLLSIQFLLLWLNFLLSKMENVGYKVSGSFQLSNLLMLSWPRITFSSNFQLFSFSNAHQRNCIHSANMSHSFPALDEV